MLTAVRLLLLRWLAARTFGGVLGTVLALALPSAAALKLVGVPLLAVAGVIGAPVAALFAAVGLPLAIVLGVVGVVVAVAVGAAMLALVVLKYVVPVLLVGWAVSRLVRTLRRRTAEADARARYAEEVAPPTTGPMGGPLSDAPLV